MQATLLLILSLALFSSAADLTLELSIGRIDIAAAAIGTKAIFAGGLTAAGTATNRVDIYDIETEVWATANLSVARSSLLALTVGTRVLFCGGNTSSNVVDIYNSVNGTWTVKQLSGAREFVKGTVVGTKAYISGGKSLLGGLLGISDLVEIYDAELDVWITSTNLLTARLDAAVTAIGDLALFIGGEDNDGEILGDIDIYNTVTDVWTSVNLNLTRSQLAAVSVGVDAYIAGGVLLNGTITGAIEVFNGTVSTLLSLPGEARCQLEAVASGVKAFFIGGVKALEPNLELSNRVDIYNTVNDTWELKLLTEARLNVACVSLDAYVFVAGGGNFSNLVDVFIDLVIGDSTPTPGQTPTPTPQTTPTPTPTPVVTPTPDVGPIQCRLDCLADFDNAREALEDNAHFTDQCNCWSDYRQCLQDCGNSDVEVEALRVRCRAERWITELCDCGDGGGNPNSLRLVQILDNFKANFLARFNLEIPGCSNAAWRTVVGAALAFDFDYENTETDLGRIAGELRVLLGKYLNQNEARFQFDTSKRAVVDGTLEAQVVEAEPAPGSAAGFSVSFAFFLVVALFHLF